MTGRHPQTEGNNLRPRRVDATQEVTAPSSSGRIALSEIDLETRDAEIRASGALLPQFYG